MKRAKSTALPALLPNATKHGAFSKIALFPGEDPEEFQRLRSAIMDEYRPQRRERGGRGLHDPNVHLAQATRGNVCRGEGGRASKQPRTSGSIGARRIGARIRRHRKNLA